MSGANVVDGPTAQHRDPRRPHATGERPALVSAFPSALALPLPPLGEAVGRTWLADHGITDTEISGRHLQLTRSGDHFRIEDAGSTNGTWLNGRRLTPSHPVRLDDGGVVRVGTTLLVFREALMGALEPSADVGGMVGPFGLRHVAMAIDALRAHPPGNVLIVGETGTGKELAAAEVAAALGRVKSYMPVNLAGVAAGVFESQLFGHVAGAFSDARQASLGVIMAHQGGAVFLDEIGELPLELQPKLLRLLENREVLPVGASKPVTVDVLLIAATNRDLAEMVQEGTFRQDLCARLSMARIDLPPLRTRREDIFAIACSLADGVGMQLSGDVEIEVEAVDRLMLDHWPHNVRGLAATLRKIASVDPEPGLHHWAVSKVMGPAPAPPTNAPAESTIRSVLEACDGNESEAARRLGVSRGKLRRLLNKA